MNGSQKEAVSEGNGEKRLNGVSIRWAAVVVALAAIFCLSFPADQVYAFNGEREGFLIGGGAGPAYATVYYKNRFQSRSETVSIQTSFIIGWGLSDQVTISYTGLQFWGNNGWREVGFALLPSLEARYFLSPTAPAFFGNLGFGPTLYDNDSGEWSLGAGLAPHFGFGYEFVRHLSAEITAAYALGVDEGHKPLFNIMLVVTLLAY